MNGEMRELIETAAELTARRLLDKFVEKLPCETHVKKIEENTKRLFTIEHVVTSHVTNMTELKLNVDTMRTKIDRLWWKLLIGIIIPLALYFFITHELV